MCSLCYTQPILLRQVGLGSLRSASFSITMVLDMSISCHTYIYIYIYIYMCLWYPMSIPPGHCKDFSASADRKVQHLPRESFRRKQRQAVLLIAHILIWDHIYIIIYIGCNIRPHHYRWKMFYSRKADCVAGCMPRKDMVSPAWLCVDSVYPPLL